MDRDGVESDPNGVPYYKWPPFPNPPDGVNIIPFSEFKPSGIQISFGDEVEVDGLGIPTVRLEKQHNNEEPPKKKKKTKNTSAGGEVHRNAWWEEWEEGEEQRILSVRTYDQVLHPKGRIAHAVEDFKRLHDWQTEPLRLLEWYGKLLYFLGLNDVNLRLPRPRRNKDEDLQPDDAEDSDDPDEATSGAQKHADPEPIKIEKFDEAKHTLRENTLSTEQEQRFRQKLDRVREAQELRLDAFVDNPLLATKIFFSSYFRDSGMMWERMALRDAPRIFEFFLNYILKTRALYEEEASLRHALQVAEKAKQELPLTMKIGANMPDELARCLTAIYGSRLRQFSWPEDPALAAADAAFKAQVEESGGIVISDLASGSQGNPVGNSAPEVDNTKLSHAEETTGGWSSIGVDMGGWGAEVSTDEKNAEDDDNPWAQNSKSIDAWALPDPHFLMTLLGPTMLPMSHTVGYVEESTRYVASVTLPGTNAKAANSEKGITTSDLFRSFAQVVLKPYPTFAEPSAPRAAIQPPVLLEDPWARIPPDSAETPRIPRHNPKKDSITMLIDPEVGKDLNLGKRMGLGGTFVQVVPNYDSTGASLSASHAEKYSDEVTFWYAEKIMQIIPSFWTEKQI